MQDNVRNRYDIGSDISFKIGDKEWVFRVKETYLYIISTPEVAGIAASTSEEIDKFFAQFTPLDKYTFVESIYGYRGLSGKFPAWKSVEDRDTIIKKLVIAINSAIEATQRSAARDIKGNNSNMNNMFGNMIQGLEFGKIEDSRIAISPKGVCFKDATTGSYKAYDAKNGRIIDVMNIKFDVPFFKMPVKKSKIQKGDILLINSEFVIFDGWQDKAMKVVDPIKGCNSFLIEETNLLGLKFYTKVVNIMTMMKGKKSGGIMNMLMMSQMFGGGDSKGSLFGSNDMMSQMMMMKMLGGGDLDFDFDFDIFDDGEDEDKEEQEAE